MVNPHGNWNTSGGSYGGGEDFGSPFAGGSPYSPPSTASEAHVPYNPGEGPRGGDTPVQTGIFQQGDPNDEKGDYIDYDYINQQTGLTAGQTLAFNTDAALKKQKERQIAMKNAMAMKAGATDKSGVTDINALSDRDLETMRDAGLFAGEAEGVLGGVAGIEQITNQSKKELIDLRREIGKKIDEETGGKLSDEEWNKKVSEELKKNKRAQQLGVLFGGLDQALLGAYGKKGVHEGYDPTGTLTWSDVESDPNLKYAYYGLTGDPSADQLRQHLPTYGPLGYKALGGARGSGDDGGYGYGYGYGGGYGGGGGGGYGYGDDEDPMARGYQRGKVGPGGLLEAVNQLYLRLSGMNKKRGGIVSLLELT